MSAYAEKKIKMVWRPDRPDQQGQPVASADSLLVDIGAFCMDSGGFEPEKY